MSKKIDIDRFGIVAEILKGQDGSSQLKRAGDGYILPSPPDKAELISALRVIFLDIDGTLNNVLGELHERNIAVLNDILSATGASIVISSNWRLSHTVDEIKALLVEKGLIPETAIIGVTPDLTTRPEGDLIFVAESRWAEIRTWLVEHPGTQYCILDDGCDGRPPRRRTVEVDHRHGLRPCDAEAAIRMLQTPREYFTMEEA